MFDRFLSLEVRSCGSVSALQDDWDIGRTKTLRAPNNMPELMNNEKIEHKAPARVTAASKRLPSGCTQHSFPVRSFAR